MSAKPGGSGKFYPACSVRCHGVARMVMEVVAFTVECRDGRVRTPAQGGTFIADGAAHVKGILEASTGEFSNPMTSPVRASYGVIYEVNAGDSPS